MFHRRLHRVSRLLRLLTPHHRLQNASVTRSSQGRQTTSTPINFPQVTNKHCIGNQLLDGTCFRGVWYSSSKEGPTDHDYANSSTCINVELRLIQQRLLHQRQLLHSPYLRLIFQHNITPAAASVSSVAAMSSSTIKATHTYICSYSSTGDICSSNNCGYYDKSTTIGRAASSGDIMSSVCPTHTSFTLCINLRDISTRTPTSFYVSTIEPTPSTLSTGVRGGLAITNSDIRSDSSSCIDRLSLQLEAANTRSKSMYGYMAVDTRRQQSTGSIFYTAGGSFWGEAPSIYPRNRGLTLRYSHAIVARRPSRNTGRFAPSHRRKLKLQQGRYPSANKPKFAFSSLDHLTRAECTVVY